MVTPIGHDYGSMDAVEAKIGESEVARMKRFDEDNPGMCPRRGDGASSVYHPSKPGQSGSSPCRSPPGSVLAQPHMYLTCDL